VTIGNVRALSIDQKSFESFLRDRSDVSLAVIQVLCERLKQASDFVYTSDYEKSLWKTCSTRIF